MKVKYSDLKNKRVFITGGGSGIGASIVEHFCEQGSEVYFVDINLKETKKLLNKIKKNKFRTPTFIECNLLDINKLEKTIKNIIAKKGPIHALIIMQPMMIDTQQIRWMKNIGKIEWQST